MIQYKEFEKNVLFDIIPNKKRELRNGQAIMIYLADVSMLLYNKITATEFDCFYVDKNIPKTLNYLEENWHLNFKPIDQLLRDFCIKMSLEHKSLFFRIVKNDDLWFVDVCNREENTELPLEYIESEYQLTQEIFHNYLGENNVLFTDNGEMCSKYFNEDTIIIDNLKNENKI